MILGIFIGASFLLLVGYVSLVVFETGSGTRVLSRTRTRLDQYVDRISFLIKHVDFGSFFTHLFKDVLMHALHEVLHILLFSVRFMERALTRGLKEMRTRIAPPGVPGAEKRSTFVETISYFKKTLRKAKKASSDTSSPTSESLPPTV